MLNFTKRTDELVSRVSLYAELFQHLSIGLSSLKFCFNQIDRFRPIRDILHEIKRFRQKQSNKFGMTNLNKRFAFTLSELLLSLIIVGVVAIITVPVLINNVQKKVFATQVKNFVAQIEQLAQDELITHRTRDLSNTDFAQPELLLSEKHFDIVKSCSTSTSQKDCWKTDATGKDKVIYKRGNGVTDTVSDYYTIVLKNGMLIGYRIESVNNKTFAKFLFDVNGNSKPNIYGRDLFSFHISSRGKIIDYASLLNTGAYSTILYQCKTDTFGAGWCFSLLMIDNWKMDY